MDAGLSVEQSFLGAVLVRFQPLPPFRTDCSMEGRLACKASSGRFDPGSVLHYFGWNVQEMSQPFLSVSGKPPNSRQSRICWMLWADLALFCLISARVA